MSTQEFIIPNSSYYYMGLMNILSLLQKRIVIIKGIYGEYFPDLKTSWITPWNEEISPVLLKFGNSKIVNNALPDKPSSQGDGNVTPWTMNRQPADIQAMYHALNDAGVTFNPNQPIDALLPLSQTDPTGYQERSLRCNSILNNYESIHEIETTIYMISISITPLYRVENTLTRSPGQLLTISGDTFNNPYLFDTNGLGSVKVPWNTIDLILTNYFSKTYLDNDMFKKDIPNISYTTVTHTGTIEYVSGEGTYIIDISGSSGNPVALLNLKLSGINAADEPVENKLRAEFIGNDLEVSEGDFSWFKDPSTVTYTLDITYYNS